MMITITKNDCKYKHYSIKFSIGKSLSVEKFVKELNSIIENIKMDSPPFTVVVSIRVCLVKSGIKIFRYFSSSNDIIYYGRYRIMKDGQTFDFSEVELILGPIIF
jgi:hypothetical protein